MDQQEMTEPIQEQSVPEIKKPNFFERFWFVFVILAILALLLVGILWASNQGPISFRPKPSPTPLPSPTAEIDTTTSTLEKQGTSDEISDIEADLNTTDLTNIDKELTDIDSELSSP